ncbi:MAG: TolC family protein [Pirellulaceae bacterium]
MRTSLGTALMLCPWQCCCAQTQLTQLENPIVGGAEDAKTSTCPIRLSMQAAIEIEAAEKRAAASPESDHSLRLPLDEILKNWDEQSTVAHTSDSSHANEPLIPWWIEPTSSPILGGGVSLPIDLDTLFLLTAQHSGRVQAVALKPWINQSRVVQADAVFDPTLYNDSRFDSTSDPVENTLTTGGPLRLQDQIAGIDTGLRGTRQGGTTYGIGQRLGHKSSNSNFFTPNNQGSSRLFANLTTPLMRGRNIDANRSLVITTQLETASAQAEYQQTLQKQIFEVADTYWALYVERASLLQRRRHLQRASVILERLQGRESLDAQHSQILRARAAVANRNAELAQAEAQIRNLESKLRALINAPELLANRQAEFIPLQTPMVHPVQFNVGHEVAEAIARRPEIAELHSQLEIAVVRLRLAQDQRKPLLNLVAEGYLAGLQGDSNVLGAFGDQFHTGRPGGAAGLLYESPIGNRAAYAVVRQRQLELAELEHILRDTEERIRAEVESSIRDVEAGTVAEA